jgi:hypothetical protein
MSFTTARKELIHKGFIVACALTASEALLVQSEQHCPPGMNFIDTHSHEFKYVEGAEPNFKGYTAMLKFGEPVIEKKSDQLLFKWKNFVDGYGFTLTREDMMAYLDNDIDEYYHLEMYSLLIEIDYSMF